MHRILAIATRIGNPLALAGFVVGVFFLIVRQVISFGLIPQVTVDTGGVILLRIINGLLILCLVAIILGFVGYLISKRYPDLDPNHVSVGTPPDSTLAQIVKAVARGRNVTINFSPQCGADVRNAVIEGTNHEASSIELLLEELKQRVKGETIKYSVKKEGAKRYLISCK